MQKVRLPASPASATSLNGTTPDTSTQVFLAAVTASLVAAHVCEARVGWAALGRDNASIPASINDSLLANHAGDNSNLTFRHRRELGDLSGWMDGRSTWYGGPSGPGPDGMNILKGSCGYGANLRNHFVAAAQTFGGYDWGLTGDCGKCYEVMCVHGKTRGTASSSLGPWEGCLDAGHRSTVVMITDSCPCHHPNAGSNQRWCCGDARHFDLSYAAFDAIARRDRGVVDLKLRPVSCDKMGQSFHYA